MTTCYHAHLTLYAVLALHDPFFGSCYGRSLRFEIEINPQRFHFCGNIPTPKKG